MTSKPAPILVSGLGAAVQVSMPTDELAAAFRGAWRDSVVVAGDGSKVVARIEVPQDLAGHGVDAAVLEYATQAVTVALIKAGAGRLLMLHACAVADRESGAAVVLVGASGMGKTTMARVLGRFWSYVTDECVALTEDLRLLPHPKPLSVISDRHDPKDQVPPSELGLVPHTAEAAAAAVILLNRDPAATDPVVEDVPVVQGIALLAEHTSYLTTLPRPLHRLADLLNPVGGLTRVTYAEAEQLEPVVRRIFASQGAAP